MNSKDVFFGLMISQRSGQDSSGVIPAIQIALDFINNGSSSRSTLPKSKLHYVLYDSQVRYMLLCKCIQLYNMYNVILCICVTSLIP